MTDEVLPRVAAKKKQAIIACFFFAVSTVHQFLQEQEAIAHGDGFIAVEVGCRNIKAVSSDCPAV